MSYYSLSCLLGVCDGSLVVFSCSYLICCWCLCYFKESHVLSCSLSKLGC
ncbi:hypothetical protein Hdeb2414_s0008g00273321 [Helianthus debilis subsp. tardiflorus]